MNQIRNTAIHTLAWVLYLSTQVLGATSIDENFWINFVCTNVPVLLLFYSLTTFILPHFFKKGRYIACFFLIAVVIVSSVLLRFVLAILLLKGTLSDLMDAAISPMFWTQFRISLLFTGISFAFWYAQKNYEISRNEELLKKEIADAQLLTLKNQINPHFLYNTLSFLYTRSLPYSSELSEAIATLSELMRYSLGEVGEDGKVTLKKEVNHLQNFIKIHQLRFANNLQVDFSADGDMEKHSIMPLLLITFVENAFKHGLVNDTGNPLTIRLHANEKNIDFWILNKKSNGIKEKSSGVGLKNIKSRLELGYPGKHSLEINDNHDTYSVHLIIHSR